MEKGHCQTARIQLPILVEMMAFPFLADYTETKNQQRTLLVTAINRDIRRAF